MTIEVLGTRDIMATYPELDDIAGVLWESFRGLESNSVMTILLGGAHSKGLENKDSDYDVLVYYLPRMSNLIALHKNTFHMQPVGMTQIREHPTAYDFRGMELEVTLAPVRTIGESGKELWKNIARSNMKTIHDFLKDYAITYSGEDGEYVELGNFLKRDFHYSLKAADGYFRGYATSQLKSRGRRADWDKRERKSHRENDVTPTVKAVMNGLYIGLSGLAFIEHGKVYRSFAELYERYQHLFDEGERYFIADCYEYKKFRAFKGFSAGLTVDGWLHQARMFRKSIYEHLVGAYDDARDHSWMHDQEGSQKANLIALDKMLNRWLHRRTQA